MPKSRLAWSCWNYLTKSTVDAKGRPQANVNQVALYVLVSWIISIFSAHQANNNHNDMAGNNIEPVCAPPLSIPELGVNPSIETNRLHEWPSTYPINASWTRTRDAQPSMGTKAGFDSWGVAVWSSCIGLCRTLALLSLPPSLFLILSSIGRQSPKWTPQNPKYARNNLRGRVDAIWLPWRWIHVWFNGCSRGCGWSEGLFRVSPESAKTIDTSYFKSSKVHPPAFRTRLARSPAICSVSARVRLWCAWVERYKNACWVCVG